MAQLWAWSEFTVSIAIINMAYLTPKKKNRNRSTVGAQDEEVIYFLKK